LGEELVALLKNLQPAWLLLADRRWNKIVECGVLCILTSARERVDNRPTVLIVDDDAAHLRIYSWIVERGGFRALAIQVQRDVFDLPETEHLDVAVLDYRLGFGLSAVDVARRVRDSYPATPILVLSDLYGMPDDIAPYASAFVRKGEPQQLLDTIFEAIKAA
jgi:CheY-like chemotaxis protein